jgi:hypothetical protein
MHGNVYTAQVDGVCEKLEPYGYNMQNKLRGAGGTCASDSSIKFIGSWSALQIFF